MIDQRFDHWQTVLPILICAAFITDGIAAEGTKVVPYYGYDDCIELSNTSTKVVLCPAAGGRVLEYSLRGENVLYLPPGDEGWTYGPESNHAPMNAGRFDIGPEKMVKRGPLLWMGRWAGVITGDRSATLTSKKDPVSGVKLVREFKLDSRSSHLICKQKICNTSDSDVSLCHWSRTFAVGKGIAIVPRSPLGRFPKGYVMYSDGNNIGINPDDPNIDVTESAVVVKSAPKHPKLGFDSMTGWLAYYAPTDQLFIKRFRTYSDRAYNEVAGLTVSVWYPKDRDTVELEPIGPAELIKPGETAGFAEEWWLLDHAFPQDRKVNVRELRQIVEQKTLPPH